MLFLNSLNLLAADIENGQTLHKGHCTRCHDTEIYTRPDRIVNNLEELKNRVQQCELTIELAWFEEEVNDVTEYLNSYFYKFGIK